MNIASRLFITALILCSFLIRNFAQAGSPEAADWELKGNRLLQESRYSEAAQVFGEWKKAAPRDHRAHFFSGLALAQLGELPAAAADLHEAFRLNPEDPSYRILLASVLARLEHHDETLEILAPFQKDWDVDSILSPWMFLLGETFNRAGDYGSALKICDVLARRHPENARIDLNRGQILFNLGEYTRARTYLEQSLEKQPVGNGAAYFTLGKTLLQLGQLEDARKAHEEAVKLDPHNTEYLWKLGAVCQTLGEHQKAIEFLEKAAQRADEYPEIYYVLARAYQSNGDKEKAATFFARFREYSASNRREFYKTVEAAELIGRGEDELEKGNQEKAVEFFEMACQRNPDDWAAHGYLAEIYLAQGFLHGAYPHLVRMEEIDPESVSARYLMARYWYGRRDYLQARAYAEKVKDVRPSNSGLRNLLGNIYMALGEVRLAVQEYSAAVELDPERPEFKLNLEAAKRGLP